MSVEVLKHGKPGKSNNVVTRCPECGCIFKFDHEHDIYHSRIYCRDYIDCPDCECQITVHDTSCHSDDIHRVLCEVLDEDEYAPRG